MVSFTVICYNHYVELNSQSKEIFHMNHRVMRKVKCLNKNEFYCVISLKIEGNWTILWARSEACMVSSTRYTYEKNPLKITSFTNSFRKMNNWNNFLHTGNWERGSNLSWNTHFFYIYTIMHHFSTLKGRTMF